MIVEFLGPAGVGKSFYSRQLRQRLRKGFMSRTLFLVSLKFNIKNHHYFSNLFFHYVAQFIWIFIKKQVPKDFFPLSNKDLSLISVYSNLLVQNYFNELAGQRFNAFMSSMNLFNAGRELIAYDNVLILDEGPAQRGLSLVYNGSYDLFSYINEAPIPDLLVVILGDSEKIQAHLSNRKSHFDLIHNQLEFITKAQDWTHQIASIYHKRGCDVIYLNSYDDVQSNVDFIKSKIGDLIEVKMN